jgi:hypothetical protein
MQATASFVLDTFNQDPPFHEDGTIRFGRAHIDKTFQGDIQGQSTVEMLSMQGNDGAGYVALERIEASINGRSGSFALLHAGTMVGDDQWATWPVVPGSGTGELAGIRGEGKITIAADGSHTFTLTYDLP